MASSCSTRRSNNVRRLVSSTLLAWALLPSGTPAETISVEQAIEKAIAHDPRISEQRHLVTAAKAQSDEVEAHGGWGIDLNTFIGLAPQVQGGLFEGSGCEPGACVLRSDGFDPGGVTPWSYTQIALIRPLNTFGKIERYGEAAAANIEVKIGDVTLQRAQTIYEVQRAYYGFLAARDSRLMLDDVLGRLERAVALVERWLNAGEGDVVQADLFALQTASGLVGRYVAEARGLEEIALDGLRVLTGTGVDIALEPVETRLPIVSMPEGDLPELQARALEQRVEMAQLDAGLRARRALVAAQRAEGRPNLYAGLTGILSYTPGRDRLENPYIHDPFNTAGLTPVLGLKWDLKQGVGLARVDKAQAELDALVEKASLARQGIPYQVAEAYYNVRAHHEALKKLDEASRAGRRWLVSSYADFEAGVGEAGKLITAAQGYVLAYTEYLKTVFDYNMYVADLQRVTGEVH